jgi:hypothetical protein
VPFPQTLVAAPTKLTAVGYGSAGNYSQYTPGQRKLMAMRAAQIDAYRNLAEQVYGFRVRGSTAVSAFATQSDTVRANVDAFIRGARVIQTASIGDDNFEATGELDMSHQFINCLTSGWVCDNRPITGIPVACGFPGCNWPSATYTTSY